MPTLRYEKYALDAVRTAQWSSSTLYNTSAVTSNCTTWIWPPTTSITWSQADNWVTFPQFWTDNGVTISRVGAPGVLSRRTKRRMAREQREWDAAQARDRERREAVQKRARELLCRSLTREQRQSLGEHGYFDLNVGGRHYRIRQGTHGNVRLLNGGQEVTSYCIQPNGVPTEDAMLAQKLLLETDEPSFLRIANARPLIIGRP